MKFLKLSLVLISLFFISFAIAAPRKSQPPVTRNFTYNRYNWPARLANGKLAIQGAEANHWKWKNNWKTVASGVSDFWGIGTNQGPIVIYQRGNRYYITHMHYYDGKKTNSREFSKPVYIIRGGQYGAYLVSGNKCYNYSWGKCKKIACPTGADQAWKQGENRRLSWIINTSWSGKYTYRNKPAVPFIARITVNKKNILIGKTVEPATFGRGAKYLKANLSNIKIYGNKFNFTKRYDGTGGISHSVYYKGRVSSNRRTIQGSWFVGRNTGGFYMNRTK